MPAAVALGIIFGGAWIAAAPLYIFVLLPLADLISGHDHHNPVGRQITEHSPRFDIALLMWIPTQLLLIGGAVWRAPTLGPGELLGLGTTVGLVAGAGGINVAHEFMHRAGRVPQILSEFLMSTVLYAHFCTEHLRGHHRRVATPEDSGTSRLGENIYTFWRRSIVGGFRSASAFDDERAKRHPQRPDPRKRRRFFTFALAALAVVVGGVPGLFLFVVQAVVAVLLLETINYVEHYGLARKANEAGGYERVQPHHSWNASQRLSNRLLFNLQRHSDHHHAASRPYWALRHYDDVPQLPFGYSVAFLVAPCATAVAPRHGFKSARLERETRLTPSALLPTSHSSWVASWCSAQLGGPAMLLPDVRTRRLAQGCECSDQSHAAAPSRSPGHPRQRAADRARDGAAHVRRLSSTLRRAARSTVRQRCRNPGHSRLETG